MPNTNKNNLTLSQISEELRKIISVEDQSGFLYFFLNYIYIEHPKGYAYMGNEAYNWQKKASADILKFRYVITKKPRQTGVSTWAGAYALWRALFFPSQIINIVSITLRESTTFLRRIKFMYEHLPVWMQQDKIEDMKTSITFKHNNSKITSLPHTDQIARGETLSMLILDEFAAYKNAENILASAVPALAAGSQIPFTNITLPSQLIIISTYPNNAIGSHYIRLLNSAREGSNNYYVLNIETDDIPFYQDEKWHKEQLEILGPRRYSIEILGEEPLESDNTLLPTHVLQSLKPVDPIRCDFLLPSDIDEEGYYKDLNAIAQMKDEFDEQFNYIKGFWVWNDPLPNHEYIIVCDVAKGAGGNNNAFIVVDLDTLEQVAEYVNNKTDLETFKHIIHIVAHYYNNAKISVENNAMGQAIVEYFVNVINYENFYFHRKTKHNYVPGFPMNLQTRPIAIAKMQTLLANKALIIKSLRLINELRVFGYTNNGHIKALTGKDDLVMCLCQYAYLLHVGWAISNKQIVDELPPSILGSGNLDEMDNKSKIYKYWEQGFDLNEKQRIFLEEVLSAGECVVEEDILRALSKFTYD